MISPISTEISNACHILFGPYVRVSNDFIHSLNPQGLKTIFKKRALETHPDRARLLNQDTAQLNERFKQINEAYRRLSSLLDKKGSRDGVIRAKDEQIKADRVKTGPDIANHFYSGKIPQWPLVLGRFLYYSGIVSWSSLIKAITWQRMQRPHIGQLALEAGLLTQDGIKKIVHSRRVGERFGECAVRLYLLNPSGLQALLKQQKQMQRPIGTYFIERGFLTSGALSVALKKQRLHNRLILSR